MQTVALQPRHRPAATRLLQELTLQVYSDLPFGTNPAPALVAEGLSYTALAAKLSGERAASVELHAVALRRLLDEQGAEGWIYRFGLAGFIHAGVLALSEQGPIFLDAFTGLVSLEPIWASLDKLSQGKTVASAPLGRARKICCIDPAHAASAMVETIALNAERELVGESQRVFSIAWRPELYMATQPEAQEAMGILGRLGAPRNFLQLLLYPISVHEDESVSLWLDEMPVIGGWFSGEDLPKGKDLPAHRLASRDRIALAATLVEQTRARLDLKEMQERNEIAVQARDEMARIEAAAEWRERAKAAEGALAEVREQAARLGEARAVALEEAYRSEQAKAEWRERATSAETALAEVRTELDRLSREETAARDEARRLEQRVSQLRAEVEAAADASVLNERLLDAEARLATVQAEFSALRSASDADAARWKGEIAASLYRVEEARADVAKERQAREEAEWRIHDLEQSTQRLQIELAQERGGRELDLHRVEEGRRLAYAAQTRLEREAETLRAALFHALPSSPTPQKPPVPAETVQTSRVDQALLEGLRAEVAAAAGERDAARAALDTAKTNLDAQSAKLIETAAAAQERDAAQAALLTAKAALDAQHALLARSRYMRLRSSVLRIFGFGVSRNTRAQA